MSQALNDALRSVALFVPKLVAFLAILLIGYIIAKLIGKAVDKLLERVGFDRAVERGGIKKALSKSAYDASDIVGKLVFYALLLFVLQMAFGVFGPNPISTLLTGVIAFLPKAIVAIVISWSPRPSPPPCVSSSPTPSADCPTARLWPTSPPPSSSASASSRPSTRSGSPRR